MQDHLAELDRFCWKQVLRIINTEPTNRNRPWQASHTQGWKKPSLSEQDGRRESYE